MLAARLEPQEKPVLTRFSEQREVCAPLQKAMVHN